MRNNLRKGLVKLGKWSLVIVFATLVTFFLGQYVIKVFANPAVTVIAHDGSATSPGDRLYGTGGTATLNISWSGTGMTIFNVSIPVGWNVTSAPAATGWTCGADSHYGTGDIGAYNVGGLTGKAIRCTSAGLNYGSFQVNIQTPTTSQTNSTWNWVTEGESATGAVYTLALDNGDVGFDIRQASNSELPQSGAQVALILSDLTNSTTLANTTETGSPSHTGLFMWESAQLQTIGLDTAVNGSWNYSYTLSRGTDFLRTPNKIVAYLAGASNQQKVVMNNSGGQGLHIQVDDELNTTRTWGEITISLYNLTTGKAACSDSELLFRNTTPSGRNYVNVTLDPVAATTGVYVQANKSGYVKTPCVQLNVSSIATTNISFRGQFNLDLQGGGATGLFLANCTTPVMSNANSTCGGLNFSVRVNAQNQFKSALPLAPANASFIPYSTFSTTFTPSFLGGDAYINSTGSGFVAINRTGYVITNSTTAVTTSDSVQQVANFRDGAPAGVGYVSGVALNYTVKVFAFDEAYRSIKLAATSTPGAVSNGTLRINVTVPTTWDTEVVYSANGEAYVAALANSTGGYNLSISKDGFVNRTYAVTPNPFNQTVVYFGNGTDNTCSATAPATVNCTNSLLFTVKITGKNQNEQTIYGFTARFNDSADNGTFANATDGSMIWAGPNVPGDVNSSAEGILYWAVNISNVTSPVRINVTMPLDKGYMEWNTTGLYINDSVQLALTSYNNFSVYARTQDQFMRLIGENFVNNVSFNDTVGGTIICSQNATAKELWGCNATLNLDSIGQIRANMSMTSGFMNGTNATVVGTTSQRWGAPTFINVTSNFSVLVTTMDENGFWLTGTSNVTDMRFTGSPATTCVQNATNTTIWGCNVSATATSGFIVSNVSRTSGYMNTTNATNFAQPSAPNVTTQTTVNAIHKFTLLVTTRDEFNNLIYNPGSSNVTNVSVGYVLLCIKNGTNTYNWGCPLDSTSPSNNITYANASAATNVGYLNGTNRTTYSLPTATSGSQSTVYTGNLFTVRVDTRDEFGYPIYSPTASDNVTAVVVEDNPNVVNCLKNSTNSSVWGCRVDVGVTPARRVFVNTSGTSGYLNQTFLNQTAPSGLAVAQTLNVSRNLFSVLVTTLSEYNRTINATNVSVQTATPTGCIQNATNNTNWGCPLGKGSAAIFTSNASGYLNWTSSFNALAFNISGSYPDSNLGEVQNLNYTYNNYTLLLTTKDEFGNFITSLNNTGSNVTDVTYRNSTGSISCVLNGTNTSSWGCAIPVGFDTGVIQINVSSGAGYLNNSNSTPYTLPATINSAQTRNETRLKHTVLIVGQNEFGTNFTIGNITNVTYNPNNVDARPCVNSSSNPQEWGCRVSVTDAAATAVVNASQGSGYLHFVTASITPPSTTGSAQVSANSRNQFNFNVTTADELGVFFLNADSVFFENITIRTQCLKNATNASIWGCPAPYISVQAGAVNVTDARLVNWTSSSQATPQNVSVPTTITSANQYTLRVNVNESSVASPATNYFTDARVTVRNATNDVIIYDYNAANATSGSLTGAYLFAVNSTAYPRVYVTTSRSGYSSFTDYNTSTGGPNNNISIRTNVASGSQVARNILLGVVAPSTPTLVSPSDNFYAIDSTPDFSWTSASAYKYELQVDNNNDFSSPTYSVNTTSTTGTSSALTDGIYYWRVRALDVSNNTAGFTAARTLTVDAANPSASTIVSPTNLKNVSGVVVINITASDATSGIDAVELWRNNTLLANLTSSPYQYNWITTSEANQPFALVARAIDRASNKLNSSTVEVTVDNLMGAPVITKPTAGQNVSGTITVDVTVNEANVQKVELLVDGALSQTNTTPAATTSFGWNTLTVADGSHTLSARVTDYANNTNTSSGVAVTVDNLAPQAVEITSHTNNSYVTGAITLIATVSDAVNVRDVQFFDNGTQIGSNDTASPWTVSWNTAAANDAAHSINVRVSDGANNVLNSTTLTLNADNTVPTAAISSPTTMQNKSAGASVTVAYTYTETNPNSVEISIYNGTSTIASQSVTTGLAGGTSVAKNATLTIGANAAEANYGVNVTVVDRVSQRGATTQTGIILVDNAAPTASISYPTAGTTIAGTVVVTTSVSDTGSSGINKTEFYIDGSLQSTNSTQFNNAQFTWNTLTAIDGGHTLTVKAYDWSGNVRTSDAVNVTTDNAAPQSIVITSPANNSYVIATINIEASVSDAIAVQTVQFYDNNTQIGSNDTASPWTVSWNTAAANDGLHNISAWVYDNANNRLIATNVTVTVDNTAPTGVTISAPTVQQNKTASGVVSVTYAYTETNPSSVIIELYNATGNAIVGRTTVESGLTGGSSVSRTDTVTLNSNAAEQYYGINVTVLDRVSQRGVATSTAIVFVDLTSPTATLTAPSAAAYVNGTTSVTATIVDTGSGVNRTDFLVDNGFAGTATGTSPSFSWNTLTVSDGLHTLKITAYDWAGLSNSAQINVTVDNTVPVAIIVSPGNSTVTGINTRLDVTTNERAECSYILDSINSAAFTVMSSTNSTIHSQNFANLAGGAHTVRTRCTDPVGAVSSNVTTTWTVDTSGPQMGAVGVSTTITNSSVIFNTTISYNGPLGNITSANFWNKTYGILPVSSDAGNSSVDVISANGVFDSTQEDVGVRVDLSTLSEGDYWVCVKGNVSGTTQGPAGCSVKVQLDKTAPKVIITSPENGSTVTTTTPTITFRVLDDVGASKINKSSIVVSNLSAAGSGTNAVSLNFVAADNCTSVNGEYEYSCRFTTNSSFASGVRYNFTISATDKAGNTLVNGTNVTVNTANTITASLTTIIRSTAVANNSYEGGWQFRFNISTGTGGNTTRMKMTNWTLAADSSVVMPVTGNVKMVYYNSTNYENTYYVNSTYDETQTVFGIQDLDSTSGTQGNVTVSIKIPTGTQSGSYSTTFNFGLYAVA